MITQSTTYTDNSILAVALARWSSVIRVKHVCLSHGMSATNTSEMNYQVARLVSIHLECNGAVDLESTLPSTQLCARDVSAKNPDAEVVGWGRNLGTMEAMPNVDLNVLKDAVVVQSST